jgi:4-amino-4-deoxy-L-arabinose transferase-like glycosyltransferase
MRNERSRIGRLIFSRQALLVPLFLIALAARLFNIGDPPLGFHPTRQYRSLLISRGYYYQSQASIPEWKREVARINLEKQGILEPPVTELLVAVAYLVLGGEHYWVPRIFTILFWLLGGYFLYRITARILDPFAALFATVFYLLLPFAVVASRSFQPDSLMVALMLASILVLLEFDEHPTWGRYATAGLFAAASIFIKPVSAFVIYAVFITLSLCRHGFKKTITIPGFLLFFPLTLLPGLSFYLYGILNTPVMLVQTQASFLPGLWFDPFYWRGWLAQINATVGYPSFLLALLGILFLKRGRPLVLVLGWWAGYVLFCLIFNYHIATHDYYHLQLIPLVGLSLSPLASLVANRLLDANQAWYERGAIAAILLAGLALSLYSGLSQLGNQGFGRKVRQAETVGEAVDHSTRTVYLDADYGLPLEYHGELSGVPWPLASDLEWERLAGMAVLDAEDRFEADFAAGGPAYFIVTDLSEYEQQEDLKEFLTEKYPVVAQDDDLLVFSLARR